MVHMHFDDDAETIGANDKKQSHAKPRDRKRKAAGDAQAQHLEGDPPTVKRKKEPDKNSDARSKHKILSNAPEDVAARRAIKRQKRQERQKKPASSAKSSSNSNPRCGSDWHYLEQWQSDRTHWKFSKLRQTWILANLYDTQKLPDRYFNIFLEYARDMKGAAREQTRKQAQQSSSSRASRVVEITALLFTVASILAPIVTAASSAASKTTAKSSAPASSSTAAAQSYIYVTEPVSSTTFIAGQSNTVAWLYKSGTGAPTTVTLELLNNKLLQNVIASNVSAKAGKYSWKVPANTGTSSAYALRFTDPTSGYTSYSANFTIQGSSSASGAMATGSSVAAMSSKAASGSASANSTSDALSLMNNHKTSTLGLVSALLSVMALL